MGPATWSIAGRVVDRAGSPVPGATVAVASSALPHRDIAAVTGADGSFRMGGLQAGSYVLAGRKGASAGSVEVELAGAPLDAVEIHLG